MLPLFLRLDVHPIWAWGGLGGKRYLSAVFLCGIESMDNKKDSMTKLSAWGHLDFVPEYVSLAVLREDYCDQETVDAALQLLWKEKPAFLQVQGHLEYKGIDQPYLMELAQIVDFFKQEAKDKVSIPQTRLGMLDLIFELSRRLRKSLGLEDRKIMGKPLAESIESPMPSLPVLPIKTLEGRNDYFGVTQEVVDDIIASVEKQYPYILFELVEVLRHESIWPWDVVAELNRLCLQVSNVDTQDKEYTGWLLRCVPSELGRRISCVWEVNIGKPERPASCLGPLASIYRWFSRKIGFSRLLS